MNIEDRTGKPLSLAEYDEAISVVKKFIVKGLISLPPELAVQLPNVCRCLEQGRALTGVLEAEIANRKEKTP